MIPISAFLTLALQCSPSVHPDTSQDVAKVESGFNPFAIGVVGQGKGIFPNSLSEALAHVKRLKAEGKNYSVGLMQINQSNFSTYGVTAEQLFDPCTNLSVYEKIITDCFVRGGTLKRALSCYYSGNFTTGQNSESKFAKTSYVQRIGYTVPSTRADQASNQDKPVTPNSLPSVHWPNAVTRGDFVSPDENTSEKKSLVRYPSHVLRGAFVSTTQ